MEVVNECPGHSLNIPFKKLNTAIFNVLTSVIHFHKNPIKNLLFKVLKNILGHSLLFVIFNYNVNTIISSYF
jgi:hypothetical protein